MKISTLSKRNPCIDTEEIADFEALFEGGKKFFARANRLLPQRPQEPGDVYEFRKKVAHHLNYASQIVGYFVGGLFSVRPEYRTNDGSLPSWLPEFLRNCDRNETSFELFFKSVARTAHVKRRAWVLVDFPAAEESAESLYDWQRLGLGNGYLCELEPECVLDWECDDNGGFEWVVVHEKRVSRPSPDVERDRVRETWRVFYKDRWERYEVTYQKDKAPSSDTHAQLVASGPSATPGIVPIVAFEFPSEVTLMPVIYSGVLEAIRKRNALSWSLERSAYAMRIFKMSEDRKPEVHGAGYGIVIGTDESVEWDSPPEGAFSPLAAYAENAKDEAFRTAHAMALAINNNAAALGRSEGSKQMDFDALNTVLSFMGKSVLRAMNSVLNLLSRGRGEKERWQCEGFDTFETADLSALFDNAIKAQTLAIQSKTFNRLMRTRAALAMVPQATQEERDAIAEEIANEVEYAPAVESLDGADEEAFEGRDAGGESSEGGAQSKVAPSPA